MGEENKENAINPSSNEQGNKTSTFNLIIGIATLLIAILGATFAYFSATARSRENEVMVKSAYVSINYTNGTNINASNLIPATLTVALEKYKKPVAVYNPETDGEIISDYDNYVNDIERKCVDAKGKEVCYVHEFVVESDGAEGENTDILAYITVNTNEFTNLSYVLYEVKFKEENGEVLKDKYGFGIVDTSDGSGTRIVSSFTEEDKNADNLNYKDTRFAKFEVPELTYGEDGVVTGSVKPVACLFGYKDNYQDYEKSDSARCNTYPITNKVKHTYQLVIWLEETGVEQPEQGKKFEGTISIEVSGGLDNTEYENGQITGQQ